jgi:hypothetical protein
MALEITFVPHGHLYQVIPLLTRFLHQSALRSEGRASIDDILRGLFSGDTHLWVVYEDGFDNVKAVLITEITQYPKSTMLTVQHCAGDFGALAEAGDMVFGTLDRVAHDAGCAGIEFFGRPGWGAEAKKHGYLTQRIIYEKHFVSEGDE